MTPPNRVHPINVVKWLIVVLLLATWTLGFIGWLFGESLFYRLAFWTLGATLFVGFSPLLLFLVMLPFELWKDRNDN